MADNQTINIVHSPRFRCEPVVVIETILDDFSPQALSYTAEQLLKIGALDAYVTPVIAKKGRGGHLLTVLCQPEDTARIEEYIFDHTSTLGLRTYLTDRLSLEREWIKVELAGNEKNNGKQKSYEIRIKIARDLNGKIINAQPEYEDCVAYAQSNNLPLKEVFTSVMSKCNLSK